MKITFRVRFVTQPGQSLWFAGQAPLPPQPVPLEYVNAESWRVSLSLSFKDAKLPLKYSYIVRQADGSQVMDWGENRTFTPAKFKAKELLVIDSWNYAGFFANAFSTEPFNKVLLAQKRPVVSGKKVAAPTHTFRVKSPLLNADQTVCLLGEGSLLGQWNPQAPLLLERKSGEEDYSLQLDLRGQPEFLAYKYGVFDVSKNTFVRFEDGANRRLKISVSDTLHTLVDDGFTCLPADTWRGAGVAVPVFSLRTGRSFGVGEFLDLKVLADWGKLVGLKLIQLLPVNDTSASRTWRDSYPYAAISAFALHPLYLNLEAVATPKNQKRLRALEAERQHLNALESVDYEAVMEAKLKFLKAIFPSQKAATLRSAAFKEFFADNEHWLVPYAAFCVLRDQFGTANFQQWPEHQTYSAEAIAQFFKNNSEMAFHYFVQFHLHLQLKEATNYAHAAGLVVKGDIAIGVARHGADAWQTPELYHLNQQAGAPPDSFSDKGQNWGFPTYNWPRMAADGFAWWKQRFEHMGNYFDAFRIDHILGFFRIWSNPAHAVEGILGHFVPAIPVAIGEFAARGIAFDHQRLTTPFITDAVLEEVFGKESAAVRRKFLSSTNSGQYALKPKFATQRQVEAHFAALPQTDRNQKLKLGLFDLISNVILLEVDGKLHFRFATEKTASFKSLPPDQQDKLRDLYVDYFFRRQDVFWKTKALEKLPALKRVTNMLIGGEDLGLVPACVPDVMRDLGLLCLEIQRMPKQPGVEFSRPADASYLSVVTPSTHDMSTIRGWWEENQELTQKFFNQELGAPGEAPREATPAIVEAVIRQHLESPAMWSIFQIQELLGMDRHLRRNEVEAERINIPAISNHYWCYRLHLDLEKLLVQTEFNDRLSRLVRRSGR